MDKDILIEYKDVSFGYDDEGDTEKLALKNINLKIYRGEFVAVLGSNGSGKSTLAKLSNAVYAPLSGKITVEGLDTSDAENEFSIRKTVGVVLQNPDNQLVASIVEEDVAFGPENLGVPQKELRRRVDEALEAVGMSSYALHETHRLSGGQKQRVAIAGMIAMRPKCLVLDEPTAMLDPSGREEVISTVVRLNKEEGMTVVLITHYMEEALNADRIVLMHDSEIVFEGTPAEVFSDRRRLTAIGLDAPDSVLLANELKKRGLPLSGKSLTNGELAAELNNILIRK